MNRKKVIQQVNGRKVLLSKDGWIGTLKQGITNRSGDPSGFELVPHEEYKRRYRIPMNADLREFANHWNAVDHTMKNRGFFPMCPIGEPGKEQMVFMYDVQFNPDVHETVCKMLGTSLPEVEEIDRYQGGAA